MSRDIRWLIEAEINEIFQENLVAEGGYARLLRSLSGLEENIDSIGIITAENPVGVARPSKENKQRNESLAHDLRELGYGFYQIGGKYGNVEKPYVIPNVKAGDIVGLGQKYQQASIIYVEKQEDGLLARLIATSGKGIPEVVSRVILPSVQNVDDFYSFYKGRNFVIPFFDEFYKDAKLVRGKIES